MNHSLIAADRATHIRMLMVAVAGVLIFIVALVGAEATRDLGGMTRLDGPALVKAGAPAIVSQHTDRTAG